MQNTRLVGLVVGVGAVLSSAAVANAEPAKIKWITSYSDATKMAKDTGALMMIDFHAHW